ncbi:hypothetical protein DIPPA_29322 [Diplonema papillatum]|nr:hypothetical protein DIPPA_29322 [Diplonema papillatum]
MKWSREVAVEWVKQATAPSLLGASEEQNGMKWSKEVAVEWVKQATGLQVC